jgi:hypothetical protein
MVLWRVQRRRDIVSSYGANEKATEKKHNRSSLPLRPRESDPSRDEEREGIQERVLAPGVQMQRLQSEHEG